MSGNMRENISIIDLHFISAVVLVHFEEVVPCGTIVRLHLVHGVDDVVFRVPELSQLSDLREVEILGALLGRVLGEVDWKHCVFTCTEWSLLWLDLTFSFQLLSLIPCIGVRHILLYFNTLCLFEVVFLLEWIVCYYLVIHTIVELSIVIEFILPVYFSALLSKSEDTLLVFHMIIY